MKQAEDTAVFSWLHTHIDWLFQATAYYDRVPSRIRTQLITLISACLLLALLPLIQEIAQFMAAVMPGGMLSSALFLGLVLLHLTGYLWLCWFILARLFVLIDFFDQHTSVVVAAIVVLGCMTMANVHNQAGIETGSWLILLGSWATACLLPTVLTRRTTPRS